MYYINWVLNTEVLLVLTSEKMKAAKNGFDRLIVYFVTLLIQGSSSSIDPCLTSLQIGDSRRTTTEDPGTCGGLCDNYVVSGSWYRLDVSNSGARMPESCVQAWHCGTYIPIWLNGAHPSESFPGPVRLPVCAQLRNNGDCCEWKNSVNVKWCKDGAVEYMVYQLWTPPFCDMAYCAGTGINCGNSGSWNDILKNCTTLYPSTGLTATLRGPYLPTGSTRFNMDCSLNYQQKSQDDGARYDVVFDSAGGVLYTQTLKSTDAPVVVISESALAGHMDQDIFCRATSYWQSEFPKRSAYVRSSSVYVGFQFLSGNSLISEPVTVLEGEKLSVTVKPTFQLGSSYSFRVYTSQLYLSSCTIDITPNNPQASFVLSPIANMDRTYRTGYFYIVPVSTLQTQGTIFNGYRSNRYNVSITERDWRTCSSTGDPHITTFYGGRYDIQAEGPYILTSIPSKKIEVQVKHSRWYYNSNYWTNCGVIAREGNNIIGINWCPPLQTPVFVRYVKDTNNPAGYILSDPYQSNFKTIVLPSGVRIAVSIYEPTHIDLTVYTYGLENQQHGGICAGSATSVQGASFFDIPSSGGQSFCKNDAILVPQCNCADGGPTASICPLPNGAASILEYSNTCSQQLQARRKRAEDNQPNVMTTPSPQPNYVWPTKAKGITEKQANEACNRSLSGSSVFDLCINQLNVNISAYIWSCVADIQVSENITASTAYLASLMEFTCSVFIASSNSTVREDLQRQFDNKVCPKQCSGNGNCVKGACQCSNGYLSSDCSLPPNTKPTIIGLPSPTCDIRDSSANGCTGVFVTASGVSDNSLKCKITSVNATSTQIIPSIDVAPEVNVGFILCHLPTLPVTLDLSRNWSYCSYTVNVSLSNDGIDYSNILKFTVFDSNCTANACPQTKGSVCCANRNVATVILLFFIYIFHQLLR